MVELNARTKRRDEDWAAFGDAVRVLADKAYPELAENARERLALNQFLEQIENSQVAFSVKQKRPRNVEEAAAAVIELESYLRSTGKPSRVNAVSSQEQEPETHHTVPAEPVSAVMHFARRARLVNSHHEITVRETAASGGAHRRKRASGPILRTASGKLPSLSGTSLPHGGRRPVKAQDDKLTVPSLAVNSGVSYRIRGVIGAVGVDFVIDTGAAVSLVRRDVWEQIVKGDCTLVLEQWAGRRLVGVNGAPLSVSGCKKVDIFLNGMPFKRLTFPSRNISVPLQMQSCPLQQNPIGLIVKEKIVIPAANVFSLSTKNLGHTKVLQHRIDTGNAQPVHLPPRRIPHARREELKEMLRDMLEKNAIEHSDSPWKVNEVTRKDAYPLPRVDDTLDTLAGSKFFSTLDLTTGYWQVEVAPEDQPKTAFTTPEDYNRRFILDTDASDTGIGAVLSQISDEGSERVIAYASRSLSRPEQSNSDSTFLDESSPFEQTTDRWSGSEAIGPVYRAVLNRKTPSADVSKSWSWESRVLMQHWGSLNIQNGVLWRKCIDKCRDYLQLVLPAKLQVDTLQDLHEGAIGGHLGEEKMLNKLKERFYWPGCTEAVKDWCRTCIRCTTRKTAAPKRKAPLQSLRAGYPMQIVCVDIMGPLPETEDGCKYVLVASDCFTRWVEVYGIPNQEATTVAKKLVDEMFCRFSPPEQLHSDQGRQFESELVKEICVLLQIRKTHTTPYHPQCNGMVERFNRTLLDMLATTIDNHQADWQHHIRKLCLAYNSSIHSTTGFSPFFLMFGRQVKLPIDLMYGTNRTEPDTAAGFAQKLKEGLQEAYKLVREKCQAEHKRQKALYDEKVHGKPFSPGDLVWLHSPAVPRGRSRKLHHPWKGPLKVVERLGESNYKIKSLQGRKKTQIVHFDKLKPCVASTAEDRQNSRPPTTPETQIDRQPTGKHVELLDSYDDEPVAEEPATDAAPPPPQEINIQPRYPVRNRHPPDRYGAYVEH
eukprot:Em0002g1591a